MNRLPYNRSYVAFQPIRVCVSIHYTPYGKGFILYWKDDFILIKEPDWRRVPWICLLIRGERILTRRGGFKSFCGSLPFPWSGTRKSWRRVTWCRLPAKITLPFCSHTHRLFPLNAKWLRRRNHSLFHRPSVELKLPNKGSETIRQNTSLSWNSSGDAGRKHAWHHLIFFSTCI